MYQENRLGSKEIDHCNYHRFRSRSRYNDPSFNIKIIFVSRKIKTQQKWRENRGKAERKRTEVGFSSATWIYVLTAILSRAKEGAARFMGDDVSASNAWRKLTFSRWRSRKFPDTTNFTQISNAKTKCRCVFCQYVSSKAAPVKIILDHISRVSKCLSICLKGRTRG